MAQGDERALVQVGRKALGLGAAAAEQFARADIEVKIAAVVFLAAFAAEQSGHVPRLAHRAQLIDRLYLGQGPFLLADEVEAVEQKAQLGRRLAAAGQQGQGDLRQIHGQRHALDAFGQAEKHLFDLGVVHHIHGLARKQGEFRIAKKPAGTEKFAFQAQASLGRCGDKAVLRGEDGEDTVRFPHLHFPQHQARRHQLHVRLPRAAAARAARCAEPFCSSGTPARRRSFQTLSNLSNKNRCCPSLVAPWWYCSTIVRRYARKSCPAM